ncbi:histidinol dehydrogenase [Rathayibacter sp. KR2-224]|uniref:histidinol dehydrogenase n=1 Tax=Rathayibacter sp. KR2-224 TaxID=3400913 RepID=UPI003C04C87C
MRILDLRRQRLDAAELRRVMPRAEVDVSVATGAAAGLISDVRERGARALLDQAERFDHVRPASLRVPESAIAAAIASLPADVRAALELAINRVREVSSAQVPAPASTRLGDGAIVEQRWEPVARAGLYVPGGKAVYPSSVIMNAVPAQVAGVGSIALASPAQRDFGGSVHPLILGAAGLVGVDEVYAMGGAGAIGALAYGVRDIPLLPVDIVTGPGNIYVAAAKRLVHGVVGIDAEAGTTEILIIADAGADPRLVASDLLSQAEHDEAAAALLVTDSKHLAADVARELEVLVEVTQNGARAATALNGPQSAIVLVDDQETAARFSDAYAPEHLEVHTADPGAMLARLTNAGAIFLGQYSPVSLGDYLAGSNHVLPTAGTARYSSGLGAHTFLRAQQIIRYGEQGLSAVAEQVVTLSRAEQLPAHGEAVAARYAVREAPTT